MRVEELTDAIVLSGGVLELQGDNVKCLLPRALAHLASELKKQKPELIALLRRRGGRVATFPHCPECCSYALYRKNNVGSFECLTCGLQDIDEATARRLV
jgi:Zn ribbon nucleic-acid-binding protein